MEYTDKETHKLLPVIPKGAFDSRKRPLEVFLESQEKDSTGRLIVSNEDEKMLERLYLVNNKTNSAICDYMLKLDKTYKRLLNGNIKSVKNAVALMRGFMLNCKGAVSCFPENLWPEEQVYLAGKIDMWFEYYSNLANDTAIAPSPETQNLKRNEIESMPESRAPEQDAAEAQDLSEDDCIKRLEERGFIEKNNNVRHKDIYGLSRSANVPKVYAELLKLTNGDSDRARRIMLNKMSGVEAALNQLIYRKKNNKR